MKSGAYNALCRNLTAPVAIGLSMLAISSYAGPVATGQIEVVASEDGLTISAFVLGHSDVRTTVEASLEIARADGNGNVRTRQSKTIDIHVGETVRVAQTGISVAPDGKVDIDLSILQGDTKRPSRPSHHRTENRQLSYGNSASHDTTITSATLYHRVTYRLNIHCGGAKSIRPDSRRAGSGVFRCMDRDRQAVQYRRVTLPYSA